MSMRAVPAISWRSAATSATAASISDDTRRARSRTAVPSSVRRPLWRSTSCTPSSFSSRAMWLEMLDCTVWRADAAAEKLPWSAMAMRAWSCRSSTRVLSSEKMRIFERNC